MEPNKTFMRKPNSRMKKDGPIPVMIEPINNPTTIPRINPAQSRIKWGSHVRGLTKYWPDIIKLQHRRPMHWLKMKFL